MAYQLLLAAIVSLPVILGLVFRVPTPHLFFSIMAGELLARYFGHDIDKLADPMVATRTTLPFGELVLLIGPLLLTAVLLKGTLPKSKVIWHIIPLTVTGIILAAFVLPLLPPDIQAGISSSRVGDAILHLNRVIIGAVVVIQLISLWLLNRGSHEGHHGKH